MKRSLLAFVLIFLVGCSGAQPAAPASPAPVPPNADVDAPTPAVSSFAGLTVETYALSFLPDETAPRLSETLNAKRDLWRRPLGPQVNEYNRRLAPFGYQITFGDDPNWGHPVYNLYHGDQLLYETLDGLSNVSVNARGDDFVLLAETHTGPVLVRPGRPAEYWDTSQHEFTAPVFVGNDLVTIVRDAADTNSIPGTTAFTVWRGSVKAYSAELKRDKVANPVKGLWAWQEHWVLELDGDVLIDGKSLKAEQGYDAVFGWNLLAGKPFYLATRGSETRAVYDGQALPEQYDQVPHYGCCSAGRWNPGGNQFMVWFFGKQGDQWSYVEMGNYPD